MTDSTDNEKKLQTMFDRDVVEVAENYNAQELKHIISVVIFLANRTYSSYHVGSNESITLSPVESLFKDTVDRTIPIDARNRERKLKVQAKNLKDRLVNNFDPVEGHKQHVEYVFLQNIADAKDPNLIESVIALIDRDYNLKYRQKLSLNRYRNNVDPDPELEPLINEYQIRLPIAIKKTAGALNRYLIHNPDKSLSDLNINDTIIHSISNNENKAIASALITLINSHQGLRTNPLPRQP